MAAIVGGGFAYRPWQAYLEQRQTVEAKRLDMEEAENRRAELAREKVRLESYSGREAIAREQGFVHRSERSADASQR
ncbi:MAG TPA: hypothetical protein PLX06_06355 [Fimbriimonadaceae bacterium]|nr:hypothetical protein [Fimbriimonadaceae bacterium]